MRIFVNNIKWIIVYILIVTCCVVFTFITNRKATDGYNIAGLVGIIEIVTFVIANIKICKRVSFSLVFALVLFLFTFGQIILQMSCWDTSAYPQRISLLFDPTDFYNAFIPINFSFVMLCFGMILKESLCDKESLHTIHYSGIYWILVAKRIIFFTFPIKVCIDIATVVIAFIAGHGYASHWLASFPNVIIAIGKISLIGFALLLIAQRDNPRKQLKLFVFILAYLIFVILSGIRSENVAYILVFVFLFISTNMQKIPLSKLLMYGILGIVLLGVVQSVAEFRGVSDKSIASFLDIFWKSIGEKNIIRTTMEEFGNTFYTAACVVDLWLPSHSIFYGQSYLLGLTAIIPSFFGMAGQITAASCYPLLLQKYGTLNDNYINIGGSILGECFFNFGIVGGIIAAFIIGLLIGYISKQFYKGVKSRNYEKIVFATPMMFSTIYWVRDYFGGGVRACVWGWIFCYVMMKTINRNKYIIHQ